LLPVKANDKGEWFSGFMRESEIQARWGDGFLTALEKGYPEHVCERLFVIGKFVEDEVVAHTSFADMGTWYFIGNNYVKPKHRKSGILKEMVQRRNDRLAHYPKIAILRPIEETNLVRLTEFIQTLGYSEVLSYADVSDVMLESEFELISDEELWRCD
tara:strand:- start:4450 stop:4923 length:474 start_codon:yes stop_codon:yes gene_type:complete